MLNIAALPKEYRDDIKKAISLLKKAGCTEIYLFGSLAEGQTIRATTDIDLAVKGLPNALYFKTLAELLFSLQHSVDLISLDTDITFAQHLIEGNRLEKIA
jgi:predicted nucleotidyltransferase